MKNIITIIAFLLCSLLNVKAQWQKTTAHGTGTFGDLHFDGTSVFACSSCNTGAGAIYFSANAGNTWTLINNGLPTDMNYAYCLTNIGSTLIASIGTTSNSNGGIYVSKNNGTSWYLSNSGIPSGLIIQGFIVKDSLVFACSAYGSGLGVYVSADSGKTWMRKSSGLSGNQYYSFAINGSDLFLGAEGNVFVSGNNASTWQSKSTGLPSGDLFTHVAAMGTNLLAANYFGGGVYFSKNYGANWSLHPGLAADAFVGANFISLGSNLFMAIREKVYVSRDSGSTWISISNGLPTNTTITSLTLDKNYIYAGTTNADIYKCLLAEATGVPNNKVTEVKIFPNPNNGIFNIDFANEQTNVTINIVDILGNQIRNFCFSGIHYRFDEIGIAKGEYYLRVMTDDNMLLLKKIVIN